MKKNSKKRAHDQGKSIIAFDLDGAVTNNEKENGHGVKIVAVGESVNDIAMFRAADIGVGYAGVHQPIQAALEMAQHLVHDGKSPCARLETL